jgi:DNA-binding beta-propeller fold protein YncE
MKLTATRLLMGAATLAILISGCATPKIEKEQVKFYPDPPALPRVQFLTSFTGAKDVEGQKSSFDAFITGEKESGKRLDKPYGVAIHEGKIYVCDTNSTVLVFDLNKKTYGPLQGAKGPGKLVQPININISRDGVKYVTDPIRGQIVVFDKDDGFAKTIGKPGGWKPVDAVPYENRLYVADIDNSAIKVFDIDTGKLVKTFGNDKELPVLDRPVNLAFDKYGYLYVTDAGRFQVVKFDRDGHFLSSIGKVGKNVGHFQRPRGLATDREGRVYVVDAAYTNVQIFNREGQNLLFFGEGGTAPGKLILPAGIAVDYDNVKYFEQYLDPGFVMEHLVIVTSQFGDRQVNVFAFGQQKGVKYPTEEELLEELKQRLLKQIKTQPGQPAEGGQDTR